MRARRIACSGITALGRVVGQQRGRVVARGRGQGRRSGTVVGGQLEVTGRMQVEQTARVPAAAAAAAESRGRLEHVDAARVGYGVCGCCSGRLVLVVVVVDSAVHQLLSDAHRQLGHRLARRTTPTTIHHRADVPAAHTQHRY